MIVIATNNGWFCIEENLRRAREYNPSEPILVVDTQSSDGGYIDYLNKICERFNCFLEISPNRHYDFGAYIHAYKTYSEEEYYFFQHDTLYFKPNNSLELLKSNLSDKSACSWVLFDRNVCSFDSDVQKDWLQSTIGTTDYNFGIYGPNFCISRKTLEEVDKTFDLSKIIVDNKHKQQGMERGWAIMFKKLGIEVKKLEDTESHDFNRKFYADEFKYFTKLVQKTRQ